MAGNSSNYKSLISSGISLFSIKDCYSLGPAIGTPDPPDMAWNLANF